AGDGLGHALSACAGMGLFSRSGPDRRGAAPGNGGSMTAELIIRLPDVGEGVAEAELVEWHGAVGDPVREDAVLAAVMTDKARVEIPSPAGGKVLWLGAEVGDRIPVGAPLIRLEVAGDAPGPEDRAMEPPAEAPQGPAPESQATAEVPPPRPARTEGP